MGTAQYIGRVGALAVALGIGAAVATMPGVALADPDGAGSSSSSDNPSPPSQTGSLPDSAPSPGSSPAESPAGFSADLPSQTEMFDDSRRGIVQQRPGGAALKTETVGEDPRSGIAQSSGGAHTSGKLAGDTQSTGEVAEDSIPAASRLPRPASRPNGVRGARRPDRDRTRRGGAADCAAARGGRQGFRGHPRQAGAFLEDPDGGIENRCQRPVGCGGRGCVAAATRAGRRRAGGRRARSADRAAARRHDREWLFGAADQVGRCAGHAGRRHGADDSSDRDDPSVVGRGRRRAGVGGSEPVAHRQSGRPGRVTGHVGVAGRVAPPVPASPGRRDTDQRRRPSADQPDRRPDGHRRSRCHCDQGDRQALADTSTMQLSAPVSRRRRHASTTTLRR